MSNFIGMGGAAGGAAGMYAAIANAIKASGAIVRVDMEDFLNIVNKCEKPLILFQEAGFLTGGYKFLTSYKGFVFYAKSKNMKQFPGKAELITVKSIWIPT